MRLDLKGRDDPGREAETEARNRRRRRLHGGNTLDRTISLAAALSAGA